MERNYTVPLRKGFHKAVTYKKTSKAVKTLREFMERHMKGTVIIGKELNEYLWRHGIKNPPAKVKVTAVKDEDKVYVNLEGMKPVLAKKDEKAKKAPAKEKAEAVKATPKADAEAKETPKAEASEKKEEVKAAPVKEEAKPEAKKAEEKPAEKKE